MSTIAKTDQQTSSGSCTATTVRLLTRGDDLGTNHSTNLAFAEACLKGILRNAGVLACGPSVEEAARMLAHEQSICFGLHSAMLAEWDTMRWGPVSPRDKVKSILAPDGNFFQFGDDLFHHNPVHDELFLELQAQLDRARSLGFDIRYVDAHMGWTWVLKDDGERFARWAAREGLVHSLPLQRFPDIACPEGGDRVDHLVAKLGVAAPGLYMAVGHPSYDNDEMRVLGHRGYEAPKPAKDREWERLIFTDPRIVSFVRQRGIEPVREDEV